ncbi:ent-copalyl diphosphate synthase, chloroplastic-like [Neltuma alba]|uniref:ent-copalyl diphosphate synthase, chloroplastic-like n=1 Tax=Neltuma alba TaxID=207710 RepID=UPI0010A4DE3E|nr:ent-copalyl diphosphate synthase, chloroplastic-like [Prosopis alba]
MAIPQPQDRAWITFQTIETNEHGYFTPVKTLSSCVTLQEEKMIINIKSVDSWENGDDKESPPHEIAEENEIRKRIDAVRMMMSSMEDGEISISAYDTAWVALVKANDGSDSPQFPSALEWIANNQLPDGSWGDALLFSAHDRILSTLACVVALTSWNLHPDKCHKGMEFFNANLSKLEDENAVHVLIGFEVAFPSLLDIARSLNIEVPSVSDSPYLKRIFEMRDLKLKKIPRNVMHTVPTTLLHSLEGMPNLEWDQLLKLQSQDGSFLFSPSSTAYALMHTKNEASLRYLDRIIKRFDGGVPNVYPVDLFEHIWVVDRLQRLGISRYFQEEIKDSINYVYRHWDEMGICWARNSEVRDIDDTAMGFRQLRLHGLQVSANVFKNFEKNGEFVCFAGQSTTAVTGMFNLYRASQVLFPGEKILEDAMQFSANYLTQKRAENQLLDKWIIMKDLPGEVGYALDIPWYASLPRLETRFYIDQYGGENDAWIGKSLYRMPYVNNEVYLELAKLDYNNCQALHVTEWDEIQGWYSEYGLEEFGLSREVLLLAYFVTAASTFEPKRCQERLAWAKTAVLAETISSFLKNEETRRAFVHRFNLGINGQDSSILRESKEKKAEERLVEVLLGTIDSLGSQMSESCGHEVVHDLRQAWQRWMSSWEREGNGSQDEAELMVQVMNLSAGRRLEELRFNPHYQTLMELTNSVCNRLRHYQSNKAHDGGSSHLGTNCRTTPEIESEMRKLVELVLQTEDPPNTLESNINNTFFVVARAYYYAAYCDAGTINSHLAKVLFHRVM